MKCDACNGSGWNPAIKIEPIDITAMIGYRGGLTTLMDYVRKRLCCPDCDGTGKQTNDEEPCPDET